ncbi:ABC transporter permease [Streptomyces fructofermentans]|uniref:ABC transporter permease n=1 Tax=Streptomyces fructofermentans TaxID=152141 RepID=A0A918N6U4_9ACTN|nr:ABC transporter permease [Streptomyces fructofermentans]GGX47930.1 hypothetical protein GCM10010515_13790 [Streptomyces fructofermentans]
MIPSSLVPRGPGRSVLRLHRAALWTWLSLVAATSAALLWAYGPGHESALADALRQCPDGIALCDRTSGPWIGRYDTVSALGTIGVAHLSFLVAGWAGAALVGRELENGTAHLAWTQSVSPARWLAAELAVPALFVSAGTTVLVLLHRLMRDGGRDLAWASWYEYDVFRADGPVAVAYALCGLALGALAGLVVGRALPALGVALAAQLAVVVLGNEYRPKLWPVVSVTGTGSVDVPSGAAHLHQGVITAGGARRATSVPCDFADGPNGANGVRCGAEDGASGVWATYHPESHFRPLQLVETGAVLAVAALAVAAAFLLLRRRTAAASPPAAAGRAPGSVPADGSATGASV